MELSENVKYMKLLHELKGAFPNMADENIQQCIKQVSHVNLTRQSDGLTQSIWPSQSNIIKSTWTSQSDSVNLEVWPSQFGQLNLT